MIIRWMGGELGGAVTAVCWVMIIPSGFVERGRAKKVCVKRMVVAEVCTVQERPCWCGINQCSAFI
jgi:hypothetical protein